MPSIALNRTTEMAEKSTIVPLTRLNYPTWKVQCKMSLIKDGLLSIVMETKAAPAEGSDHYTKYRTRRDKALATIVLSIDPSLLYLIGDRENPVVVWKLFSEQSQKVMWAYKLALRRRIHSLRLKEGESVQDHVKAITAIFNKLSMIGDDIQDEDRVIYLLASLPKSFDMLVTALEASVKVLEMSTVVDRLLHKEQKI